MPRKGGWRREGTRGRFRYYDARGSRITDADKLARIESLVVPPAWRDVWISPRPTAKLQATGLDKAGRRQYIYHPDFRARQDQAKYERLIRFAERLPDLRLAMAEHMDHEVLDRERVCAIALRLINRAWFRVGTDRYVKQSKTFGITTLTKRHVQVRGNRVAFKFRAKHKVVVRTVLVDSEIAAAMKELLELPGRGRLFRYLNDDRVVSLTGARLNEYVREYLGEEFTAKDFRTWGGTLTAAIAFAERGPVETVTEQKRVVAAGVRPRREGVGNTPAVARSSHVSPALRQQYRHRGEVDRFLPPHLRRV